MLHPDGVEVYIKSPDCDKRYVEYLKPGNSEAPNSKSVERYIYIKPEDRFSIFVGLQRSFDFRGQNAARVILSIDNAYSTSKLYAPAEFNKQSDGPLSEEVSRSWRVVDDVWTSAGLYFAEWKPDKSLSYEKQEDRFNQYQLASIEIRISLGTMKQLKTLVATPLDLNYTASTFARLTKEAGIISTARPVSDESKKLLTKYDFKPALEDTSDYRFTFRYRTKYTLKRLGIKPSSRLTRPASIKLKINVPKPLIVSADEQRASAPEDDGDDTDDEREESAQLEDRSSIGDPDDSPIDGDTAPDPEEQDRINNVEPGHSTTPKDCSSTQDWDESSHSDIEAPESEADNQAKIDGRKRFDLLKQTMANTARQRSRFSLVTYRESEHKIFGRPLGVQLVSDTHNRNFSLSGMAKQELVSMAIDSSRIRHVQWSPYGCNFIRLNGAQEDDVSLARDLTFPCSQEAELFIVKMKQMTALIVIGRTSQRMLRMFKNFPVKRQPVCGGPNANTPFSQRPVVPLVKQAKQPRISYLTPVPSGRISTADSVPSNQPSPSQTPQAEKRKATGNVVTDDEEDENFETTARPNKKVRSEAVAADMRAFSSPPSSEPSTATPLPEKPSVVQTEALGIQSAQPPQNDIIDLTEDDDDVPIKPESAESRTAPKGDEEMSKDDILDEIRLLDIQRREIELRGKLRKLRR